MKKLLLLFVVLHIVTNSYSQQQVQVSIGTVTTLGSSETLATFSETDNVLFFRSKETVTGSVLLFNNLIPKLNLRYGMEFRGSPLTSEMRFDQDVNGQNESIFLVYDYKIIDVNLPVDLVFLAKKWVYTFAGVYPTFRVNLTSDPNNQTISFLPPQQTRERLNQLDDHLTTFGMNYRIGFGFKYKFSGIEFSYEKLITNNLKDQFVFNQVPQSTVLKHATFVIRLAFNLIHSPQKFLSLQKD